MTYENERYPGEAGIKDDAGKAPMDLLPWKALVEVAHVMGFGASKYYPGSWRLLSRSRLFGAACRHMAAYWTGETNDPETGRHHLAHAASCLLDMVEQDMDGDGEDDRPGREGE